MLFGQKGAEPFHGNTLRSWGEYPRQQNSTKTDEIRELVQKVSPGPHLEMYGREKRKGWTVYGNQLS